MAFDAGSIRTQAELDLAAFKASMTQLEASVAQINKTLAGVQPVTPQVDPEPAKQQVNVLQQALGGLLARMVGIKGKAEFEIGDAQKNVDGLTQSLGDLAQQMGIMKALGGLGPILGAGSLIAVAGAAAVGLANIGAEFKRFTLTMQNASGATQQELASMRDSFTRLFAQGAGIEGSALAQALPLISRRLKEVGPDLETTTGAIIRFTRVMGGDLLQNAELATRVFQQFGVAARDQGAALEFVTRAAQLTGESGQELLGDMKGLGVISRALGLNFQETTAFITAFKERGLEAGDATRGLTQMLANAAKAGLDGRTALESLFRVLAAEPDSAKAAEIATEAFGRKGALVLKELAQSGARDLQTFIDRVNQAPGALETAAAKGETAAGRMDTAVKGFIVALEPGGTALLAFAQTSVVAAIDALGAFGRAIDDFLQSEAAKNFAVWAVTVGQQLDKFAEQQRARDEAQAGTAAAARKAQADQTAATQQAAEAQGELADQTGTANEELGRQVPTLQEDQDHVDKLTGKAKSLTEQLAALSDVARIQGLLESAEQAKTLEDAITSLTDKGIAAQLVALRNASHATDDVTESYRLWDEAVALAQDHLAAQKATQEAANEAQRKAAAEVKAIEDAMQKASTVAQDTYFKRFEELAKSLLPGLTAETQLYVESLLIQGQAQQAAAVAGAAHGISQEELTRIVHGTNEEFQDYKKTLDEVAKASDPSKLLRDELKSRGKAILGAVADQFDAVTAANIKARATVVGDMEAIAEALQAAGGDADKFRNAFARAMLGTAEDARQATESAKAAAQFLRTGFIPEVPKPPTDAWDKWTEALQKAQETFADANQKTRNALADAQQALEDQRTSVLDALDQAEADYDRTVDELDRSDREAVNALNQAAIDRGQTFAKAMDDLQNQRTKAIGDDLSVREQAAQEFTKTVQESSAEAAKAVADLNEKNRESTEQANTAMQAAWHQSAQALAALNQQQQQLNLQLSRQLQDITEKGLIGPQTQQQQNELAIARLRAEQDAALQQMALSEQERQARGAFGLAVTAADKQAQKNAQEMAKALAKILEDQRKKEKEAADKRDKAIQEADKKMGEALGDLLKKGAELQRKYDEERKKAEDAEKKRQHDLEKKRDEAERKREKAEDKAAKDWDKADRQYEKRVRDIHIEQDKAARAYQKALTEANKDLGRSLDALLQQGVTMQQIMKAVLARQGIDMPVHFNNLTVQETGVDFLKVLVATGRERLKEL